MLCSFPLRSRKEDAINEEGDRVIHTVPDSDGLLPLFDGTERHDRGTAHRDSIRMAKRSSGGSADRESAGTKIGANRSHAGLDIPARLVSRWSDKARFQQ